MSDPEEEPSRDNISNVRTRPHMGLACEGTLMFSAQLCSEEAITVVVVGVLECQLTGSFPPLAFEPIGKWVLNQQIPLHAVLLTKLVWGM